MPLKLTFPSGATCVLDSSQVTHVRPKFDQSLQETNPTDQLQAALAAPLEYPALAKATVPGDRVVLPIAYGTPCPGELIKGLLAALRHAGVESSDATLLLAPGFSRETELQEQLSQLAASQDISLQVHDPDDDSSLTIIGVTKSGRPLRLNRLLGEADMVLPLSTCTFESNTDKRCATFGGLFPNFSDRETLDRYRAPIVGDSKVIRAERKSEINESGWLLGVGLTIQVVPNPSDGIAAVFAGEPIAVAKAATEQYRDVWACGVDRPVDLVVATMTGDSSQQAWENVGRALEAAESVLEPGGTIALCSDLTELPGPSLQRLASNDPSQEVERELMRDRYSDSLTALRLSRALQRGTVYFRSQLAPSVVESLGMAPLATEAELSRLVSHSQSCLVLDGAQRLLVTVG